MTNGVVAITGAARGIGKALAREAVSRGYDVALFDRDWPELESLRSALGEDRCKISSGDVSSDADLQRFTEIATSFGPPLRIAFANAGILRAGDILDQPITEIEQMLAVNVMGAIRTARVLVPHMQHQNVNSIFVFTGSTSMLSVAPGFGGYAATKHALLAVAEALDAELLQANSPVRAAILCPAAVQTGIADGETALLNRLKRRMETHGISPAEMAKLAFDGIIDNQSVIFSSEPSKEAALRRLDVLLSGFFAGRA
jgi:short-subunit dehydrogenase